MQRGHPINYFLIICSFSSCIYETKQRFASESHCNVCCFLERSNVLGQIVVQRHVQKSRRNTRKQALARRALLADSPLSIWSLQYNFTEVIVEIPVFKTRARQFLVEFPYFGRSHLVFWERAALCYEGVDVGPEAEEKKHVLVVVLDARTKCWRKRRGLQYCQ